MFNLQWVEIIRMSNVHLFEIGPVSTDVWNQFRWCIIILEQRGSANVEIIAEYNF
jgi:hypothetical protein